MSKEAVENSVENSITSLLKQAIEKQSQSLTVQPLQPQNNHANDEKDLVLVPRHALSTLSSINHQSSYALQPLGGDFLGQILALTQGADDMDSRDMVTVMSVGAIVVMSMVMLFQSMTTAMLLKKLM